MMNYDFVFKRGDDKFQIVSFVLKDKMKIFSQNKQEFIQNRCARSWVDDDGHAIYEYEIKTNASKEIINNFIQYSIEDAIKGNLADIDLNPADIEIYLQLSKEFEHVEFEKQIISKYKCLSSVLSRYCSKDSEFSANKEKDERMIVNEIDSCFNDEKCRQIIIEEFSINELHRIIEKLRSKRQSEPNIEEKLFELLNERIEKKENENQYDDTALLLQYLDSNQLCDESKEKFISITDKYGIIVPKLITELHHQSKHSNEIQHKQEEEINKIQLKLHEFETLISEQQAIIKGLRNANEEMKNKLNTIEEFNKNENSKLDTEFEHEIQEIREQINTLNQNSKEAIPKLEKRIDAINNSFKQQMETKLNNAIDERTRTINGIQGQIKEIRNELNSKFDKSLLIDNFSYVQRNSPFPIRY